MKKRIDEYKNFTINNDDKGAYREYIQEPDNINPRYIKENSTSKIKDTVEVKETVDKDIEGLVQDDEDNKASADLSSVTSQTAGSVASSIGSGFAAVAGAVATSVVGAIVVAVAFISTLTINLKLVMSSMTSLVFELEMQGAQEQDFESNILAILTSDDGTHYEIGIDKDTLYLTFEDLSPGTEYLVTVKNDEKTFVKSSYITLTEEVDKGVIYSEQHNNEGFVYVQGVSLKAGEYYTVVVKNSKGDVVFTVDGTEPNKEYSFVVGEEPQTLYCSLIINGQACSVSELVIDNKPEYDFSNPIWTWNDTFTFATLTFNEKYGKEPLVLEAAIESVRVDAKCEEDGSITYTASASYFDEDYSDTKVTVLTMLGHTYGDLIAEVQAKCEETGIKAHYHCTECGKDFLSDYTETTEEGLILEALGHTYGELIAEVQAKCEEYGVKEHYHCEACDKNFNIDYTEVSAQDLLISPTGHNYGDIIEEVPAECEKDGFSSHFYCPDCGKYFLPDMSEVAREDLVINATGHTYGDLISEDPATCEATGTKAHYHCDKCSKDFDENLEEVTQEELVIEALGHTYGDLIAETPSTCSVKGTKEHYHCSECGKYFDVNKEEVTLTELELPLGDHSYVHKDQGYSSKFNAMLTEHYECENCNKLFDLSKNESTVQNLTVSGSLNIGNGNITVYTDGYTVGGTFTPFSYSESNPLIIYGSAGGDHPLLIYSYDHDGSLTNTNPQIYLVLDTLTITARSWCSAVAIDVQNTLTLNITINGTTTLKPYNHPAFAVENSSDKLTINLTSPNGFDSLICQRQDGGSPTVFKGSGKYYMNGVQVDNNGNPV